MRAVVARGDKLSARLRAFARFRLRMAMAGHLVPNTFVVRLMLHGAEAPRPVCPNQGLPGWVPLSGGLPVNIFLDPDSAEARRFLRRLMRVSRSVIAAYTWATRFPGTCLL